MTRNTLISLAKKYTMAPGHQLQHLYIRAHPTLSQHQYLRVLTEHFCLWRVTYSDKSAQAILYHFPGPQASLHHHHHHPHPPTPFYWHVISWRSSGAAADRHTIYDRAKQPDRSSGSRHPRTKTVHQRVSQHHMTLIDKQPSLRRGNASDNVESQVTQTTRWTYEKTERKCGSTHYVALPHTAFTGVTKLTHTPPTLKVNPFDVDTRKIWKNSTSYLLIPWQGKVPGHQQAWYWLYRMNRPFFYFRHLNVEKQSHNRKYQHNFMCPEINSTWQGLTHWGRVMHLCTSKTYHHWFR